MTLLLVEIPDVTPDDAGARTLNNFKRRIASVAPCRSKDVKTIIGPSVYVVPDGGDCGAAVFLREEDAQAFDFSLDPDPESYISTVERVLISDAKTATEMIEQNMTAEVE